MKRSSTNTISTDNDTWKGSPFPKKNNDGHKGVVLHSPTVGRRYYPTDCFVIWQTIFLNEQNYFFWLEMSLESAQVTFS
ncbi:AIF_HP2_G0001110.mRNA.1.CDS.1 [Saccharomyces cerevisiae]|nr:AIF_HP2_G0001110.mRNA.1.CDS.1 [Saccharomyces cerevisiae]CAI6383000.1 AIF_HP2_G0001110.mRNA.1.CDS.1 [Saccharomyces cerevisiae]